MRGIIKAASIIGISTAVNLVLGLLRGKYLAWQLGPVGLGIIAQISMFSQFAISFCSLNIGYGMMKYISEYRAKGNIERVKLVIHYGYITQIFMSLIFVFISLLFSKPLSMYIFSSEAYRKIFMVVIFAIPFTVLHSDFYRSLLYGFNKITAYTKAVITASIINFLLLLFFVYYLDIKGVFIHFFFASVVFFILFHFYVSASSPVALSFNIKISDMTRNMSLLLDMVNYGATALINGLLGTFTLLYLRSLLIKESGAEANGYYQIAFAISAYYQPFLTNALWAYFYPKMSGLKDKDDYSLEINNYVRFCVLGLTPIIAFLITFKLSIIRLMFTKDFLPAAQLIVLQGLGDFFYLIFYILNTSLFARGRLKSFLCIATLGYNSMSVATLFCALYVFDLGYKSLTAAYLATNLVFVLINLIYHNRDIGLKLTPQNVRLISVSLLFIGIIIAIPDYVHLIPVKILLFVLWFFISITKHEIVTIKDLFLSRFLQFKKV